MNYVVIFKAKMKQLDAEYRQTAQQLREQARTQYNGQKFEAVSEQGFEIALSYWNSLADIQAWHQEMQHQIAQQLGRDKWYQSFSVEVCKLKRAYTG